MRVWIAATIAMVLAGVVVWIVGNDTTLGQGIALSLVGIASVIAVSLVFFAVGRSEDVARAADETARDAPTSRPASPQPPASPPPPGEAHPRPALDRRRARPPRRPS
jgi:hypothetical protein